MRGVAGFRAAGAFLIALAASCAAVQRAASTTELSYVHGTSSSSGTHAGAIGDGRAPYAGTSHGEGDFNAVGISIRPLAALDGEDESRAALRALAVELRARAEPASPAPFAEASIAKTHDGRVVVVSDGKAEILDPLEPLRAIAPTPEAFGASQAGAETPAATLSTSGVPADVWISLVAVLTALAGWIARQRVKAARAECATSGAPRPSLVAAALRGRSAGRRAPPTTSSTRRDAPTCSTPLTVTPTESND